DGGDGAVRADDDLALHGDPDVRMRQRRPGACDEDGGEKKPEHHEKLVQYAPLVHGPHYSTAVLGGIGAAVRLMLFRMNTRTSMTASWPGLSRPSASCLRKLKKKDVDARHEAGHDASDARRASSPSPRPYGERVGV